MRMLSIPIILAICIVFTTVKGEIAIESDETATHSYMRGKSFKNVTNPVSSSSLLDISFDLDNNQDEQGRQLESKEKLPPKGDKKTVYAFFQEINEMTEINEKNMIENWKKAWADMGWTPKVLTFEDAKKHPKYWDFEKGLKQIPLKHPKKSFERSRMSYLRWLAMAAVGGGWMSDYDTIPLRGPMDTDNPFGKFHVYQTPGIPSLLSGSAGEWTRMAENILQTGIENKASPHWSDWMGLITLLHNGKCQCKVFDIVLEAEQVLTGKPFTKTQCNRLGNHLAVHFSTHSLIQVQDILIGKNWRGKPRIIKDFAESYITQCKGMKAS